METPVNALPEMILLRAESLPEGGVLSPKEFLHLGSRTGINQALSRLTKAGKLLRAARGIYVAPVSGRFGMRPGSNPRNCLEARCGSRQSRPARIGSDGSYGRFCCSALECSLSWHGDFCRRSNNRVRDAVLRRHTMTRLRAPAGPVNPQRRL